MTDRDGAREPRTAELLQVSSLLTRAEAFGADSGRKDNSLEGRFLLAYQSAVQLLNALLIAGGAPSSSRRGTHIERIEAARVLLPESTALLARIDNSRRSRNLLVYAGERIETELLTDVRSDLAHLREAVLEFLRREPTPIEPEREDRDR